MNLIEYGVYVLILVISGYLAIHGILYDKYRLVLVFVASILMARELIKYDTMWQLQKKIGDKK